MPNKGRNRGRGGNRGRRQKNKQTTKEPQEPQDPMIALKNQGNEAFGEGDFERAVFLYTQALNHKGDHHVLFSNLSAAKLKLNEFGDAMADAEKCIELRPAWPKGYIRKACVYEMTRQILKAKETYEAGMEACPPEETPGLKRQLSAMKARVTEQLERMRACCEENARLGRQGG